LTSDSGHRQRQSTLVHALPRVSGTYLLQIYLERLLTLSIGRLGMFTFPSGWYLYVGSARGPGGLKGRLGRHYRRHKRIHWHIDYLLAQAQLRASHWVESPQRLECKWATALDERLDLPIVAPGFGASDCRCVTHLYYSLHRVTRSELSRALEGIAPSLTSADSTATRRTMTS
jgi:Uri superfamily endonuclease